MFMNTTVAARLTALSGILCALMVVVGVLALHGMSTTNAGLGTVYNDRVVPLKQLKLIADAYAGSEIDAANKMNAGLMTAQEGLKGVREASAQIDREWKAYMATTLTEEETRLAKQASVLFDAANKDVKRLETHLASAKGNVTGTLGDFDGPLYATIDPIGGKIGELIYLQLKVAKEEYERAVARYETVRVFSIGATVFGALFGALLAFSLIRGLSRQLGGEPAEVSQIAGRMAEGDLTVRVNLKSGDTTSAMAGIKLMSTTLTEIIGEVNSAADALGNASGQVSATAQSLSQSSSEQAASVEETTASIEQMTASITQNTEYAKVTDNMATKSSAEAEQGGSAVKETVEAMKSIAGKFVIILDIQKVLSVDEIATLATVRNQATTED